MPKASILVNGLRNKLQDLLFLLIDWNTPPPKLLKSTPALIKSYILPSWFVWNLSQHNAYALRLCDDTQSPFFSIPPGTYASLVIFGETYFSPLKYSTAIYSKNFTTRGVFTPVLMTVYLTQLTQLTQKKEQRVTNHCCHFRCSELLYSITIYFQTSWQSTKPFTLLWQAHTTSVTRVAIC